MNKNFYIIILVLFFNIYIKSIDQTQHHVICKLSNQQQLNKKNYTKIKHSIHDATNALDVLCQAQYKNSIENNEQYPCKLDTVFFVHINHDQLQWTLYKPSFISYEEFITLAKKTYKQYKLNVSFSQDQVVSIMNIDLGLDSKYISLQELEEYKKLSDSEISILKSKLEDQATSAQSYTQEINQISLAQKMKPLFFWHLENPTIGLLENSKNISYYPKPLAWNFLLWDLAPKKGAGAKVAIIDTGSSAFNFTDEKLHSDYKKNINISLSDQLDEYGYNLVSQHGLDPIHQIAINFANVCDHEIFDMYECMQNLPKWIIEIIKEGRSLQVEQYLAKNVKKEYLNRKKLSLNQKGEDLLKDLLYGKFGIAPKDGNSFFTIVHGKEPYDKDFLLQTLPTSKNYQSNVALSSGHGTFTQGIVNGKMQGDLGITGLAPQADVIMIKAFHDDGTTNKTTLNAALQRALTLKAPIVSMSLKITDTIDPVADATLKSLIDSIDYVVAASGNDGMNPNLSNKEAYPARFDSVAFDVGAFQYDDGNYSICSFTQKESGIGPKIVAPGFDILSAGLVPGQVIDSMYIFMAGTSVAVPIVSGFLALLLAEFQDKFTRQQILKVVYRCTMRLNNDISWQQDIILGAIDMRSSLLCLHILYAIKIKLEEDKKTVYNFDKNFDILLQAVYEINYYPTKKNNQFMKIDFTQNFKNYTDQFCNQKQEGLIVKDLNEIITFAQSTILHAINPTKYISPTIDDELEKNIATILKLQNNLFNDLPLANQQRINLVLQPKKSLKK